FRYIGGGLFKDMLPTAEFDAAMRRTLIDCCKFDWSKISPAIFGAMFQGIMNRDLRREIGAHYTSEGNILKLINPLFRDELWKEFERVKINEKQLDQFHDQIAKLKFLDPACGCGNFLMLAYRELRILELEILKMKIGRTRQKRLDVSLLLKVSVDQFYGIEIEDFPCEVARVGMWLVDHQMNLLVAEQFGQYYVRLPLTQSATIVHGNALRIDWESIVPKEYLSFIMGNPPYVGYSFQKTQQKEDILSVYLDANGKPLKTAGKIDYVAAWYYKASKMMVGTRIRTAFVSTNSITQGEQVAAVWKPLFELFDTHIDFAYQRFKWTNEAKGKAAVHCVIIGFSTEHDRDKVIYEGEEKVVAKNISPYLVAGPNILIESRKKPLCDVPEMSIGNRPADGGHLIIEGNEYAQFVEQEPGAKPYIRQLVGAEDYINNIKRYCLWLVDVAPSEIRKMPKIMERIQLCKLDRLNSRDEGRRKLADSPALFREAFNPEKFLLIPRVSSEKRRYIPFGFLDKNFIPHDTALMIPYATLYHFGVLTSSVHMAWMRQICGRLEIDYRYSKDIVYNNFPWPEATDAQKANIEILAQGVLDARAKFPGSSLADLYDPLTMPPELLKAHQALDHAVMKLYGFGKDATEAGIVAKLMVRYQELTG
ncbi:MAG: hypothetical protein FWH27_18025, partial [Planctomycetaceae bacterium]|nr:hypothetical protein [Planctomycetaceae bacterium]